jgi:hypothetical protein
VPHLFLATSEQLGEVSEVLDCERIVLLHRALVFFEGQTAQQRRGSAQIGHVHVLANGVISISTRTYHYTEALAHLR